jgi:hypothetical protein
MRQEGVITRQYSAIFRQTDGAWILACYLW